jgi:hypothetical protein
MCPFHLCVSAVDDARSAQGLNLWLPVLEMLHRCLMCGKWCKWHVTFRQHCYCSRETHGPVALCCGFPWVPCSLSSITSPGAKGKRMELRWGETHPPLTLLHPLLVTELHLASCRQNRTCTLRAYEQGWPSSRSSVMFPADQVFCWMDAEEQKSDDKPFWCACNMFLVYTSSWTQQNGIDFK